MPPTSDELIAQLRALGTPENIAGQQRFAIRGGEQLGVSVTDIRKLARGIHSHELAQELWNSGIHEAQILAAIVDEPAKVTLEQMESWVSQFQSWDICDETTDELFIHTAFCQQVIPLWAAREEEFVRRASFAMIAALSIHRKDISDDEVKSYFALIEAAAEDDRNFVKKAVNLALRNLGKFRPGLREEAVACARRVLLRSSMQGSKSARWIAGDALKEFEKKFGTDYITSIKEHE
jgi:3-methyladenine DNA glycosylase AlkD